jgi:hypothetical protein
VKQACCLGTAFEMAGALLLGEWPCRTCSIAGTVRVF